MFTPISNLDVSWPDPSVNGGDQIQKYINVQNQYLIQTSSVDDASNVGTTFSAGVYYYIGGAISKSGIITIAPYFATSAKFYDTNTGVNSSGSALSGCASATYSSYNDAFYYGSGTTGLTKVLVSNLTSASAQIGPNSNEYNGYAHGKYIYYGPGSTSGPLRILDVTTDTIITGSTINEARSVPTLAPNSILFFGSEATSHVWYDLNTGTTGTCSGTTDSDSAYSWILAGDGNLYSVPRFRNNKVYRLNPNTKTITMVLNDANYGGAGEAKRGQWIGPDGNIWTYNANVANKLYSYNWRTNQMTVAPYTYSIGGSDRAYSGCVMAGDGMYFLPWDSNQFRKYYKTGFNTFITTPRVGNPINRCGNG